MFYIRTSDLKEMWHSKALVLSKKRFFLYIGYLEKLFLGFVHLNLLLAAVSNSQEAKVETII
jgi:hypothetical protein